MVSGCDLRNPQAMFGNRIAMRDTRRTGLGDRSSWETRCYSCGRMVLRYLLLLLLNGLPQLRAGDRFFRKGDNGVGHRYSLEGLSSDIMQKIQRATGYPFPAGLYPAQSRARDSSAGGASESKTAGRVRKKRVKGFASGEDGGGETKEGKGKYFVETQKSGGSDSERRKGRYGARSGSKDEFMNEAEFTDDHYHMEEGDFEKEFKGAKKRIRAFFRKGFEDVYHKDEKKKANTYWDNQHTEGKWFKFGSRKESTEKDGKKDESEEKHMETEDAEGYKTAGTKEGEKNEEEMDKKENHKTTGSEHEKKVVARTKARDLKQSET